jgi:hypothetical protein
MTARHAVFAAVLAGSLTGLQARVWAQDETLNRARAEFERGQGLYEKGKYSEAAEAFQKAYESRSFPQFLFNVGACYERLRDYRRAVNYYQRYITELPDAADKNDVERRIAVLRKEEKRLRDNANAKEKKPSAEVTALGEAKIRGLVVIESDPPNAVIYLDDKKGKSLSKTPWNGTLEGDHTIYIEREGYKPVEKRISPDPNRLLVLVFSLAEEDYLGWLKITSNVPGADIYLDDKSVGVYRKTPWQGNIEPGKHKIWVTKEGYDEYSTEIEVIRGKSHSVEAKLSGGEVGFIYVRGPVDQASIYIDGKLVCKRGPCRTPVKEGLHQVTVKREGYKDYEREVDLRPQNEVTIRPRLAEAPSRVDAYVAYSIAGVFFTTGIVTGVMASSTKSDVNSAIQNGMPPPDANDGRFNRARVYSIVADASFAVGTIALATALYYTFRDKGAESTGSTDIRTLSVSPEIGPSYAGVGMEVRW